jgi:phosphohistidine phosphatase
LSRRGREAARLVGETLPAALGGVDLVLCSSARRTAETAELVLAGFATPPRILLEDELYLVGRLALLRRLSRLDEADGTVLVIGHNPGLHELALALAEADSPAYRALAGGKFPTTARASFAIDCAWSALDRSRHALVDYVTVKSLDYKD